ncbi:hypothetical protein K461DRAFT_233864 [Myriangium duriaei CBS 260.36]|uniref:BRCT domain-containing protein n=1 Tax=Myriangium duriaei CBS 260.36 TaxID=1168546 RepID=A0A9P4MFF1_9PEZI|nr:hypothetical protein K461DRAFT_233864 [Myriangium duriaei CBS 260.36]
MGWHCAGSAQQPLKGAILCSTSLSQDVKAKVGSIGAEMGAVHKLDLTSDVTHLLVGNVDSEKYRHVAKRRPDILVLRPEWLFAVRDSWVQGDDFDLDQLNAQFQLPTFHSLNICVTGFNDARQRQWLEETCAEHGAQYHGDLTKAVTHLVAAKPTGAKYDRAKQWNIKVVSLRWFERSLERRMILDENAFDPLIEEDRQGEGAYEPQVKKQVTGKRGRAEETGKSGVSTKRKMRRTASARLSSQSQNMWQDITTTDGEASLLEDSWSQSAGVGNPPEPTVDTQPVPEDQKKSFSSHLPHAKHAHSPKPLFADWNCLIHGHNQRVAIKLKQLLEENGATVVESETELQDPTLSWTAMILPTAWLAKSQTLVPRVPVETKVVTEWWVERCIVHKKILDPDKDTFSRSMHDLPSDTFQGRVISTSGFGQDVRYVAKIVEAAGGAYEENLSRKVNLLVFNHSNDLDKPAYCAERNIDVVSPEWLHTSLREQSPQAVYPYMLPRHLCDAIQRIISARRKSESQAAENKEETQKT